MVLVQQLGQTDLGAHAVSAGDQHRLLDPRQVGGEQAAEAADAADHSGDHGAGHVLFHELYAFVAGLNIHAGGSIGCGMRVFHGENLQKYYSFPDQQ